MTSKYLQPAVPALVAEAEYMSFAPASCSCCACLYPQSLKKRQYARLYENKIEWNVPVAPFCCFTTNTCILDWISVNYYDRPPVSAGMCCYCIPAVCCGPPVIFGKKPSCCCIDLTPMCGQMVMAAPCDYFGLKVCCGIPNCCIGKPCYLSAALPIIKGVKNSEKFVADFNMAVDSYAARTGIPRRQMATFKFVNDGIFIGSNNNARGGAPIEPQFMVRHAETRRGSEQSDVMVPSLVPACFRPFLERNKLIRPMPTLQDPDANQEPTELQAAGPNPVVSTRVVERDTSISQRPGVDTVPVASVEVPPVTVPPPARNVKTLVDMVEILKRELDLSGSTRNVIQAACLDLGVTDTGSLGERARLCIENLV